MTKFTMPRGGAAGFASLFRARSFQQKLRRADAVASLRRGMDRNDTLRDRIRQADRHALMMHAEDIEGAVILVIYKVTLLALRKG